MHSKPPPHSGSKEWAEDALALLHAAKPENLQQDSTGVISLTLSPKTDFAGNNGHLVFRQFDETTYNGPKKEDFIKLAMSYYRVTKKELEKTNNPAALKILEQRMQVFLEELKILEETKIDSKDIPENFPVGPGQFALKIKQAENLIKQLNIDLAAILLTIEENKKITDSSLQKKGEELRKLLKRQIEEEGRANSIHLYKVPNLHTSEEPIERLSMVTTVGKTTVPSSVRTGDYENQGTAISNFVRRSYGSVTRDEEGKPTVNAEFSGLTHSSYPPVDLFLRTSWKRLPKPINKFLNKWESKIFGVSLDAEIKIRERAIKGVEQVLQEFVKEELAKGATEPITINLTTLSLVTPIFKKSLERLGRPAISESKQLEEVMLALSMSRGKTEIPGPDGKPIQIKIDMTHMNMPTNLGTRFKPYFIASSNPEQQYSHARGFYDYCVNVKNFLADPKNIPIDTLGLSFNALNKCLTSPTSSDLNKLEYLKRSQIDEKYKQLYQLQMQLQSDPKNPSLRKEYQQLLKDIKLLEKEHKTICLDLINEQKNIFLQNKEEALKELKKAEIMTKNLPKDNPLRIYVDNCRLMFNAQDIYYNGTYKNAKHSFDFQALYLLSNQRMGRKVEWFCKSAEDRAGRTGEKIEELLTFNAIHGCFPSSKKDQLLINQEISPKVHQGSISMQVTDDNDPGARGLQVGSDFGSKHLHLSKVDKKMSRLAKNVFKFKIKSYQKLLFLNSWIKPSKTVLAALDSPSSSTLHYEVLADINPIAPKETTKDEQRLKKIKTELDRWSELERRGFKLLNTTEEKARVDALKALQSLYQNLQEPDLSSQDKFKLLQKADSYYVKLKNLYPGSQANLMQDSVNFNYLGKKTQSHEMTCQCSTVKDYEKLAKQSESEFKRLAKGAIVIKDKTSIAEQQLLKGVLYKKSRSGNIEITIPPDQHIKREYVESKKKVEIQMNSSSDRAIFINLQANKQFFPIKIELPRSQIIQDHHIHFLVNTMLAAKIQGISVNYDPKYDEVLNQEKFRDQRIILDILKQTPREDLVAFSKDKTTLAELGKSLLEAVAPAEGQQQKLTQ